MGHRIYIEENELSIEQDRLLCLTGDRARYMNKVLRLGVQDTVILFNESGMEYSCTISEIDGRRILLTVGEIKKVHRESNLDIVLCQALSKGKKMDFVIQKGTELGVKRFIPVVSSRSVSRHGTGEGMGKIGRWKKIALESARQSGRNFIPQIDDVVEFNELQDNLSGGANILKIIPWEEEKSTGLKSVLESLTQNPLKKIKKVIILIGPEGGFSDEEVESSIKAGYIPVTLGKRILRTETAALAAVSIIQFCMGDMG